MIEIDLDKNQEEQKTSKPTTQPVVKGLIPNNSNQMNNQASLNNQPKQKKKFFSFRKKKEKKPDVKPISLKKEHGKFKVKKLVYSLFVLIAVTIVCIFAVDRLGNNIFSACTDGNCSTSASGKGFLSGIVEPDPELKQDNGLTSVLIVGLDARYAKKVGDSYNGDLMNTDTLIQLIYNHKTKEIVMISVPRDLYVQNTTVGYSGKVNGLWSTAEGKYGKGKGITYLEDQITTMTGVKNQYYAIVTFDIVKDLINTFGDEVNGQKGLYIDVPEAFNERFPDDVNGGYFPIHFDAGRQFIDTERLMQYSRARQLTSDWKRAARQQQVVDALKDKVLGTDSLLNPTKLLNVYNTFKSNVILSPVGTEDIKAALSEKDQLAGGYTSVVLDPKLGGINKIITTYPPANFQGASLQGPVGYDYKEYEVVKDFVAKILKYPSVYEEMPKIVVYNYTGEAVLSDEEIKNLKETLPVEIQTYNRTIEQLDTQYELYDFSNGKMAKTLTILEKELGVKVSTNKDPETGGLVFNKLYGEDISIRVSKPPVKTTTATTTP